MGIGDFWSGWHNRRGSDLVVRDIQGQLDYETGKRLGRRKSHATVPPGTDVLGDSALIFKTSLVFAGLGAIGGFGYGLWLPLTDQVSPGLGVDAITVLKWTGVGAGAGALLPTAFIVALGLALIVGVLVGLGYLLDFLTKL
jgi:hypothetical protein